MSICSTRVLLKQYCKDGCVRNVDTLLGQHENKSILVHTTLHFAAMYDALEILRYIVETKKFWTRSPFRLYLFKICFGTACKYHSLCVAKYLFQVSNHDVSYIERYVLNCTLSQINISNYDQIKYSLILWIFLVPKKTKTFFKEFDHIKEWIIQQLSYDCYSIISSFLQ
jgi:hypothetical protein